MFSLTLTYIHLNYFFTHILQLIHNLMWSSRFVDGSLLLNWNQFSLYLLIFPQPKFYLSTYFEIIPDNIKLKSLSHYLNYFKFLITMTRPIEFCIQNFENNNNRVIYFNLGILKIIGKKGANNDGTFRK